MEVSKLETLAKELFVDNFKFIKGKYVSPLNVGDVAEELRESEIINEGVEKELYGSLVQVAEAIDTDGGISEGTYEAHKYAINSLARDLTNQRWWGSGLTHLCEREDREGRKVSQEQIARFPEDKFYKRTNLFDTLDNRNSGWEGTLFQTEYDAKGNLEIFRIFHQGHRNSLSIKTSNVHELIKKIKTYVNEYTDRIPEEQFGFTLDKKTYLQRVEEFNAEFGGYIHVEIVDEGKDVVARFYENPEKLANKLFELGKAHGLEIKKGRGSLTYFISRDTPDMSFVDLLLPNHIEQKLKKEVFDTEQHKNSHTLILPYLSPKLLIPLMKLYISAQEK